MKKIHFKRLIVLHPSLKIATFLYVGWLGYAVVRGGHLRPEAALFYIRGSVGQRAASVYF